MNWLLRTARTFSDKRILASSSESAVDFADQFHVVQERVEGIEVGEAHHVRGATPCCLGDTHINLLQQTPSQQIHKRAAHLQTQGFPPQRVWACGVWWWTWCHWNPRMKWCRSCPCPSARTPVLRAPAAAPIKTQAQKSEITFWVRDELKICPRPVIASMAPWANQPQPPLTSFVTKHNCQDVTHD